MYHPDENNYFDDKLSVYIEKVKVPTQDGLDLLGWYHEKDIKKNKTCLLYTSPSPRDDGVSRMPSSA